MSNDPLKTGISCPMCGLPLSKAILFTLSLFVTIFFFDWIFHGIYMMPAYEATAALWRSPEAMKEFFHIGLIRQGLTALAVVVLYGLSTQGQGRACCKHGVRFGLAVGLLLGISQFGGYAWMPIPLEMALSWLAGSLVLGVILGLELTVLSGVMCRPCGIQSDDASS